MTEPKNDLSIHIAAFCGLLRDEHGFEIGHREAHDALRAIAAVGIDDRDRVRSALRLVCCGTHAQTRVFDRIFDEFFLAAPRGLPQAAHAPRHTRPGREKPTASDRARDGAQTKKPIEERDEGNGGTAVARRVVDDRPDDATGWQMLRARYSPAGARGTPLVLDVRQAIAMRSVADRVIASVALGRSRRWKAMDSGGRFDIRRTIRTSLQTGGDPVALRFLGHPRRNPRFVVLIDGSRSTADHTTAIVAFAAALSDRTSRANIFFFSTALRDVTRDVRVAVRTGTNLGDLGDAWGGGTKIGVNLARFVDEHGARLLSPQTLVIVFSDGLDVGDIVELERAMREIDRRSAGIVWLNPHAGIPGYAPAARGMRAALPYITLLCAANDTHGFEVLAQRIAQTARIRGRRR